MRIHHLFPSRFPWFDPMVSHVRSWDDPKNLILLCTSQGTFVQQDGPGSVPQFLHQRDAGNHQWRKKYLEAAKWCESTTGCLRWCKGTGNHLRMDWMDAGSTSMTTVYIYQPFWCGQKVNIFWSVAKLWLAFGEVWPWPCVTVIFCSFGTLEFFKTKTGMGLLCLNRLLLDWDLFSPVMWAGNDDPPWREHGSDWDRSRAGSCIEAGQGGVLYGGLSNFSNIATSPQT